MVRREFPKSPSAAYLAREVQIELLVHPSTLHVGCPRNAEMMLGLLVNEGDLNNFGFETYRQGNQPCWQVK